MHEMNVIIDKKFGIARPLYINPGEFADKIYTSIHHHASKALPGIKAYPED